MDQTKCNSKILTILTYRPQEKTQMHELDIYNGTIKDSHNSSPAPQLLTISIHYLTFLSPIVFRQILIPPAPQGNQNTGNRLENREMLPSQCFQPPSPPHK